MEAIILQIIIVIHLYDELTGQRSVVNMESIYKMYYFACVENKNAIRCLPPVLSLYYCVVFNVAIRRNIARCIKLSVYNGPTNRAY